LDKRDPEMTQTSPRCRLPWLYRGEADVPLAAGARDDVIKTT